MSEVLGHGGGGGAGGDPARANILCALLDGRALTATELAFPAHVTPQTASGHLAKLVDAQAVLPAQQGRHRYFRLASPLVGRDARNHCRRSPRSRCRAPRADPHRRRRCARRACATTISPASSALRSPIRCIAQEHIQLADDGRIVTANGRAFFDNFGIELSAARGSRRAFCRPCLDWSERRPHLAGALGAAMARRLIELRWIARQRDTQRVRDHPGRLGRRSSTRSAARCTDTRRNRPLRVVAG